MLRVSWKSSRVTLDGSWNLEFRSQNTLLLAAAECLAAVLGRERLMQEMHDFESDAQKVMVKLTTAQERWHRVESLWKLET